MADSQSMAERLRALRTDSGLTFLKAAVALDVSLTTISRLESGACRDLDIVCRAAELYGVSLEWLVHGRGPRTFNHEV